MQNTNEDRVKNNICTATLPLTENVYSNIDPVTGKVTAPGDYAMPGGGRVHYSMMTSSEGLSRNFSASRSQWSVAGNYKGTVHRSFSHLVKLDFVLKILEIISLIITLCLYSNQVPSMLDIFEYIIFPMIAYGTFTIITLITAISSAFKLEIPALYLVIISSVGAITLSVSGGMMLGVWFLVPRKVKAVLYWESRRILMQSMLSFFLTIVFLGDLACSLNTLNGNR